MRREVVWSEVRYSTGKIVKKKESVHSSLNKTDRKLIHEIDRHCAQPIRTNLLFVSFLLLWF